MMSRLEPPEITTERLVLRCPVSEDFPVYERFYADASASAAYGGPLTAGQAWRKLALDIGHWQLRGFGMWSIVVRTSNEMVGGCGLFWPAGWPRSELTWWITPAARRNGYAIEASRAAIQFGYECLVWPVVETHINDENVSARQLALKLGGKVFAREKFPDGLERDIFAFPRI